MDNCVNLKIKFVGRIKWIFFYIFSKHVQFLIDSEQNFVDSVSGTWYCTVRRFVLDHFLLKNLE